MTQMARIRGTFSEQSNRPSESSTANGLLKLGTAPQSVLRVLPSSQKPLYMSQLRQIRLS